MTVGLFTALLTLPLAPVRGVAWVADQVAQEVDRQMYDQNRIRAALLELELDADAGAIDEEERAERENELFERLAIAQSMQHGFGTERWENLDG